MCEYCNEPYKNMSVSDGIIRIEKSKFFPSEYELVADNSAGECGSAYRTILYCPMCGRKLSGTED